MALTRKERYRVTPSGVALHVPSCAMVQPPGSVGLTLAEARAWLSIGDRRFCCRTCMPADPREVRLA